jgi:MFS family permease
MTSQFYLGMIFGAIISGHYADRTGRKKLVMISAVFQIIIKIMFLFVTSFYPILILRFLTGFFFGFGLPLTTTLSKSIFYYIILVSEITPIEYRGKILVLINFFMTLGKLLACILIYIFI